MLSFFKKEVAQKNMTGRNKKIASVFWRSDETSVQDTRGVNPPG